MPGLGRTAESYSYVIDDGASDSTTIRFTATITVQGKGTIGVSAATPSPVCPCTAGTVTFDFTFTGGTGTYAGAQGSGTAVVGRELASWSGALTVPGYAFDTTPPVIKGAVSKTVIEAPAGATRMRVKYAVSARDPGEGSIPVTCTPRSGSRFKLGRTPVRCAATDANGNSAKARFVVTVKRA